MSDSSTSAYNYTPTLLGGQARGSFRQRQITLVFDIYESTTSNDADRVTLSDLRVSYSGVSTGGATPSEAQIRVYGVPMSLANKITSTGKRQIAVKRNLITVQAGDPVSGLAAIFQGNIITAFADYSSQPDAAVEIVASSMFYAKINPVPATSVRGLVDAAILLQNLATQAGYLLVNHGVTKQIRNPNYPGTALDQIKEIASHCDIEAEPELNKLHIWNKDQGRNEQVLLISPETGLTSYPRMSSKGVTFSMLFNATLGMGSNIKLESSLEAANGMWTTISLQHNLESESPSGAWTSQVECSRLGDYPTAPAPETPATPTINPAANTPTPSASSGVHDK